MFKFRFCHSQLNNLKISVCLQISARWEMSLFSLKRELRCFMTRQKLVQEQIYFGEELLATNNDFVY